MIEGRPINISALPEEVRKSLTDTSSLAGVIPEVWSQEIEDSAQPNRVMRGLIVVNTELLDGPGDVVHIPRRGTLTATHLGETDDIIPETWTVSTALSLEPEEVGAAVEVTRKSMRRAYIPVLTDASEALGESLAQIEDVDIITAGVNGAGTTIYSNGTGLNDITADDIFTVGLFKDAVEALETANCKRPIRCLIHPAIKRSLLEDEQFTNASEYGDPSVVRTGELGEYLGVKVYESTNALNQLNEADPAVRCYATLFWGPRGLAIALKANPDYEDDYAVLKRRTTIASVMEYDVGVLNDYQLCAVWSAGGAAPPA